MSNNLQMIHENAEAEVHAVNDQIAMDEAPDMNMT